MVCYAWRASSTQPIRQASVVFGIGTIGYYQHGFVLIPVDDVAVNEAPAFIPGPEGTMFRRIRVEATRTE